MEFNKLTLLKLYKSLNQVERSQKFKELRINDIYLDGIIHQGYSGMSLYEALKNSIPVVCKYFPSSAKSEAEKEWNINWALHEKVNNSQHVVVYKERLQTSSGAFYLIMENYGSWSLLDIAARKYGDNFYHDKLNPKFPSNLLKRICYSVLSGLKNLELIGYYHSDIKLGNIMLAHDGTPTIIDLVEVVAER
jgi:serine/threonine protein kinase